MSASPPAENPPSVFANRVFRNLWIASLASHIGTGMHDTAAAWTLTGLGASATVVTLLQTAASLPLFLFGLPAGALADIVDRRKLLLFAQVFGLLSALALAVFAHFGTLTPGAILFVAFLLGLSAVLTMPTWQAAMAEIVTREQMPSAVTLGGAAVNMARVAGPAAGGYLLSFAGPAAVFALNAASFLVLIGTVFFWRREHKPAPAQPERIVGAMTAALRYVRHSRPVKGVLLRAALFVFAGIAPVALLPLLSRLDARVTAGVFGLLMSGYGIGAVLTALIAMPRLRRKFSADILLVVATVGTSVACAAFVFTPSLVGRGGALFAAGCFWIIALTIFNIAIQSALPNWIRSRGSAVFLIAFQGSLALGAFTWGQVTQHFGLQTALLAAAGFLIASLALAKAAPLHCALGEDVTPSAHWGEHHLTLEPAPDDGPVLITIDYRVSPESAKSFRVAMERLREVRLRDGGFRWVLWQSLDDPALFREIVLVDSWGEHLRQHARATVADRAIEEAAQRFHAGPGKPEVRHFFVPKPHTEEPKP